MVAKPFVTHILGFKCKAILSGAWQRCGFCNVVELARGRGGLSSFKVILHPTQFNLSSEKSYDLLRYRNYSQVTFSVLYVSVACSLHTYGWYHTTGAVQIKEVRLYLCGSFEWFGGHAVCNYHQMFMKYVILKELCVKLTGFRKFHFML